MSSPAQLEDDCAECAIQAIQVTTALQQVRRDLDAVLAADAELSTSAGDNAAQQLLRQHEMLTNEGLPAIMNRLNELANDNAGALDTAWACDGCGAMHVVRVPYYKCKACVGTIKCVPCAACFVARTPESCTHKYEIRFGEVFLCCTCREHGTCTACEHPASSYEYMT